MKTIYYNANVITLEEDKTCEAFLVENGIFKDIGDNLEILKYKHDSDVVDLCGKTVIPAFIDSHSHLSSYANSFIQASLDGATSFEDIINKIKEFVTKNNIKEGQWIIANGYDHNNLVEKSHPTKELIDKNFAKNPVVLEHISGHFGVFNSDAINQLSINHDNLGLLEENEYVNAIKEIPMPSVDKLLVSYTKALEAYASYGITTVQEGMMVSQMIPIYKMLLSNNVLTLDVVGYPQVNDADTLYDTFSECVDSYYRNFRLGGYKIILDGSPQGKTAWMKTAYDKKDYYGVSNLSDEKVMSAINKAIENNRQLLAHCNGDAAIEQFLSCAKLSNNKKGLKKIRPVIIHAQLIDINQLQSVRELGIILSFFIAHCYYWGDTHIKNFGYDRASKICPAKSAEDENIIITLHQDTPVVEPDMIKTIWCAVNRQTKSGIIIGEKERLSVMEALRAVTINAAYQYGEEKVKGSIKEGKKADFVVLSNNPLCVPKDKINNIYVEKTFRSGICIFQK